MFSLLTSPFLQFSNIPDVYTPFNELEKFKEPPVTSNPLTFGTKYDTLIKLHDFFKKYPSDGVVIPLPEPVASEEIEKFIKQNAPEFFKCWEKLASLYSHRQKDPNFFEDTEVTDLINQAKKELKTAFEHFTLPSAMSEWLKKSSSPYFMVRSSGAEDGKKTANAGANLSCNYVKAEDVPNAIEQDIDSYISKRSLLNRHNNGENPFTSPLHLAVFVQELIGEAVGGESSPKSIPISVVLFTNEPLYVGKEPFRVMKLSATFGHGEAVVKNRGIATDTVYILDSLERPGELYVWYDKMDKLERLAPMQGKEKVSLEAIANPDELIHSPALSSELVKRLFSLGKKVEGFFNNDPTDMELVIKDNIIHIVQARPLNRQESLPTYIDLDASTFQQKEEVKILTPGTSSGYIIDSGKQILATETLEEAQYAWKEMHKLVTVKQDEPLNSHPIINMTERGVSSLYHKDGLEEAINEVNKGQNLAICTQQGLALLTDDKSSIQFKEGYISHPAPLSAPPDLVPMRTRRTPIPEYLKKLIEEIKRAKTKEVAYQAFKQLSEHLSLQNSSHQYTHKTLQPLMQEIQQRIQTTLQELGKTIEGLESKRLPLLFHAKALETLIWGQGSSLIRLEELSKGMMEYELKLGGKEAVLAKEALYEPLSEQTAKNWVNFLANVERTQPKEEVLKLQQLLHNIGDALPLWLTFFFDPASKRYAEPKELLNQLHAQFDSHSQNFVEKLSKIERSLSRLSVEDFGDPVAAPHARLQLLSLIKTFEESGVIESFEKSTPLAKVIAARTFAKATDFYDRALKSLKISNKLTREKKIELFKEILQDYITLMNVVAKQYVGEGKFYIQTTNFKNTLAEYLAQFNSAFTKIPLGNTALDPSKDFSVQYATLGNGTTFYPTTLKTLEDFFTLTHQNLLACVSRMVVDHVPQDISLPPLLLHAIQQAKESFSFGGKPRLIGIQQDAEKLVFSYNMPLDSHSSTFQLIYKEGKLFFSAQLLGYGTARWQEIGGYIKALHILNNQPLAKNVRLRDPVLDFTWSIENEEQLQQAFKILGAAFTYSLEWAEQPLYNPVTIKNIPETIESSPNMVKYLKNPNPYTLKWLKNLIGQGKSGV